MRSKLMWCAIWLLTGALVIASVDGKPDPPATDPHPTVVKAFSLRDCASSFRDQADFQGAAPAPTQAQLEQKAFVKKVEPNRPSEFLKRAGQASDASPPVPVDSLRS
jgi:hypothetical protein